MKKVEKDLLKMWGFGFLPFGLILVGIMLISEVAFDIATNWKPANATITKIARMTETRSSAISKDTEYYINFHYDYTVGNQNYSGTNKLRSLQYRGPIRKLTKGSSVPILYNPKNPEKSRMKSFVNMDVKIAKIFPPFVYGYWAVTIVISIFWYFYHGKKDISPTYRKL